MQRRGMRGGSSKPFIITVKTDNVGTSADNQFTIPTAKGSSNAVYNTLTYNYTIKTSDGQVISGLTEDYTITFPSIGTYDIEISGTFPMIYFVISGEKLKLIDIKQWGGNKWFTMDDAFFGCANLEPTYVDAPNLSNVNNIRYMFRGCTLFNHTVSNWDTSNIVSMYGVFYQCSNFNQPIPWDTSNVVSMDFLFYQCSNFNQPVNFNTVKVSSMLQMFQQTAVFNQPILFDTSALTTIRGMFIGGSAIDTTNVDNFWINCANQTRSNVNATLFSVARTSASDAAIATLIGRGWTF